MFDNDVMDGVGFSQVYSCTSEKTCLRLSSRHKGSTVDVCRCVCMCCTLQEQCEGGYVHAFVCERVLDVKKNI